MTSNLVSLSKSVALLSVKLISSWVCIFVPESSSFYSYLLPGYFLLRLNILPVVYFAISFPCLFPRSEKEPQFKFIYFNHMNLAEKSTIHVRRTPHISLTSVHPDLMKILGDINSDFTRWCFPPVPWRSRKLQTLFGLSANPTCWLEEVLFIFHGNHAVRMRWHSVNILLSISEFVQVYRFLCPLDLSDISLLLAKLANPRFNLWHLQVRAGKVP